MLTDSKQPRVQRQALSTVRSTEHVESAAILILFSVAVAAVVGIRIRELAQAGAFPIPLLATVTKELAIGSTACYHGRANFSYAESRLVSEESTVG